jgi:hypothetical protein
VAQTPEYRARSTVKLMNKELYTRAMGRVTDVAWKVGDKSGWDVFYDKVGGMDYRKIETRDRGPSIGYSLVQFKGAAESCNEAIDRDVKAAKAQRHLLDMLDDTAKAPSDAALESVLSAWYARMFARSYDDVTPSEKTLMKSLYRNVEKAHGVADGYKAVCTALLGSADFALF